MTIDLAVKETETKKAQGDIVVLYNFFHKNSRTVTIREFVQEVKELTKPVLRQLADGIRDESYDY